MSLWTRGELLAILWHPCTVRVTEPRLYGAIVPPRTQPTSVKAPAGTTRHN